jgi:hypothetical protein
MISRIRQVATHRDELILEERQRPPSPESLPAGE